MMPASSSRLGPGGTGGRQPLAYRARARGSMARSEAGSAVMPR